MAVVGMTGCPGLGPTGQGGARRVGLCCSRESRGAQGELAGLMVGLLASERL